MKGSCNYGINKSRKNEVVWVHASSSISGNERVYTFDKTYAEIGSLLDADFSVILNFGGSLYIPTWYSTEEITFLNAGDIAFETLSINTENNVTRNTLMFSINLFTINSNNTISVSSYFKNIDKYIEFNTQFLFRGQDGKLNRLNFSDHIQNYYIFYYDSCNEGRRYVFTINKDTLSGSFKMFNMNLTEIPM